MPVSPDAGAGGPGIGTIWNVGTAVADQINRWIGSDYTAEQRAALRAGDAAGYRHLRTGWVSPDGTRVLERDVIAAGRIVLAGVAPTAPPAPGPTTIPGTGPSFPPPSTPPINPTPTTPGPSWPGSPNSLPTEDYEPRPSYEGETWEPERPPYEWDPWNNPRPKLPRPGPSSPDQYDIPRRRYGRILSRASVLAWILWPSEIGDSTVSLEELLRRTGKGRGPTKRPRIRRPPAPKQEPVPKPPPIETVTVSAPRVEAPIITSAPAPIPTPTINVPAPAPIPPTSSIWSTVSPFLPFLLPLALAVPSAFTSTGTGGRGKTPTRPPLTPPQEPIPQSQPKKTDDECQCPKQGEDEKRKKKRKKPCKNPVISSRKVTKDGKTLQYITKEIKCQASSRKKRPSAQASPTTTFSAVLRSNTFGAPLSSRSLASRVQRELLLRSKQALRLSSKNPPRP